MNLMNLNLDGVRIEEEVTVPADGIVTLGHNLFKPEPLDCYYDSKKLTAGQDYVLSGVDERLYYQKNVTLFTKIKILNDFLLNKVIKVTYYACGDYVDANIWRDYPTAADLKNSLASKVDNKVFLDEVARLDDVIIAEATVREQADTQLHEKLASETNLRTAADEQLQENINSEAQKRKSADEGLTASIAAEAEARTAQDDILSENIRQEEDTRAAADEQLQLQVTDLKTKFESFVPGLTYKVVAQLPTENILSDVIYMVPAGTQGENQVYDEYLYIEGVWELIGSTATTQAITVDQALSSTSENPVQNKVISAALAEKLGTDGTAESANRLTLLDVDVTPETDTPTFWKDKGFGIYKYDNNLSAYPSGGLIKKGILFNNIVAAGEFNYIVQFSMSGYTGTQSISFRFGSLNGNKWGDWQFYVTYEYFDDKNTRIWKELALKADKKKLDASFETKKITLTNESDGIYAKGEKSTDKIIGFINNQKHSYGNSVIFGGLSSSDTYVGSGESVLNYLTKNPAPFTENLFLLSDYDIKIRIQAQNIASESSVPANVELTINTDFIKKIANLESDYAASLSVSGEIVTLKSKSGATLSTISAATQSTAGLMSAADKKKLDALKYSGDGPLTVTTLSGYESMILCCNRNNGGYLEIVDANTGASIYGKVYVNNNVYTSHISLTKGKYYVIVVTENISVKVNLSQNGGGGYSAIRI